MALFKNQDEILFGSWRSVLKRLEFPLCSSKEIYFCFEAKGNLWTIQHNFDIFSGFTQVYILIFAYIYPKDRASRIRSPYLLCLASAFKFLSCPSLLLPLLNCIAFQDFNLERALFQTIMVGKLLPAASPLLSQVATSGAHGEDSPYFAGWRAFDDDPYDAVSNPSGVIQMGLAENQVSFDLLEEFLSEHPEAAGWGGAAGSGVASFRDIALFQDYHGLKTFRKVRCRIHARTQASALLLFVCLCLCRTPWTDRCGGAVLLAGDGELHGEDKGRQGEV